MTDLKNTAFWVFCLLLMAGLLGGCGERFPAQPPAGPAPGNDDMAFGLYQQKNGIMRKLTDADEDPYELYASFTNPWFTWQSIDPEGYWVYVLNWHYCAVADTGLSGVMLDSLYIAVGDTINLHLLTGLKSELNGNYYQFKVLPDLTVENYSSANNTYWVSCFHGESVEGDLYQGSLTNWSERLSSQSWWPVRGESEIIFEVFDFELQSWDPDTLLYVVSYDGPYPNGSPIDTLNVENLIQFGGNWHPYAYLNDDGTWDPGVGYPIIIWIKP